MLTSSKKCIVIVLDRKLMYLFKCMLNNVGKLILSTEEPYCGNISQRSQSTPCSIPFTLHLGKLCYCICGGKGFSLIKVNRQALLITVWSLHENLHDLL